MDQITARGRFPIEAVCAVKQNLMQAQRSAAERDAKQSVDVLASRRPLINSRG